MSDELFRAEALEYFAHPDGRGELLRVRPVWLDAAYWSFLALVALGVVLSLLITLDGTPLLFILLPALEALRG